jgi:cephalosporin-C deacetylase-like acetyl esterase
MRSKYTYVFIAVIASAFISVCPAQVMSVVPDKTNGVYEVGDTVHWQVQWSGMARPSAHYRLLKDGLTETRQGNLEFSNNIAQLESRFIDSSTMLVEVKWTSNDGKEGRAVGGAVAAPAGIGLSAPCPADFDEFWKSKLKELKKVPANPKLESVEVNRPNVSYWKITLDNIRGTHIHGQLARPTQGKKFPALLIVQWAGVYGLQTNWVTDRAAEGWLVLNIEPHDLPIDEPASFYKEQGSGPLKNYWAIGNDDRDTSYYLRMYLSCYRAAEYLAKRKDWDGDTLVVMGDSQGGMQTLMLAGLDPGRITAALALVPAGCDMLGPQAGRAPGWPHWYDNTEGKDAGKVHEASRYYDVVNFAQRIKCPVLIGLGLRDEVCPPSSVLAAVNVIKSPKEVVILPRSGHQDEHGTQAAYNQRKYGVWLPALRQGKSAPAED